MYRKHPCISSSINFLTIPIMRIFAAPPRSSIKGHADLSGPHGPKLYSSGGTLKKLEYPSFSSKPQ
ncbi:hypothetical protein B5F55_06905 [Anaerotruncus colihominis]|nr:hypothetical protein B5F55_06905 [Anaerotruncus colihominis]